MNEFIKNLKTPIAIVGMGKSGSASLELLKRAGISDHALLTFDGKLPSADFNDSDLLMTQGRPQTLVVSPGVPLSSSWIQAAKSQGVKITSELALACSFFSSEKVIGVTGSVGKSTTVSILGAGLAAFSDSFFVGGNLGTPLAQYSVEVLQGLRKRADWVVLELSSYQLENCENLALDFSAITYFTSNHLERYENLAHYYETKWKILSLTKNQMFLNSEGGDLVDYFKKKSSPQNALLVSRNDHKLQPLELEKALLIGQHNQDNLALASTLALAAGWPQQAIEGIKKFQGLEHRLENVGVFNGVRYINDSKATAMDSVLIATSAAHETLQASGQLYLLLGGKDKNLPWEDLHPLKSYNSIQFVFFGDCREKAQQKSQLPGNSFTHLGEALDFVFKKAKENDTILLSPGGTSLDEFKSFEHRGQFFKEKIQSFIQRTNGN